MHDLLDSLPSVVVRLVTHVPGVSSASDQEGIVCCVPRDPGALPSVSLADVVTCAPWAAPMFTCLTDTQDLRLCSTAWGPPDTSVTQCDTGGWLCDIPAHLDCVLSLGHQERPRHPRNIEQQHHLNQYKKSLEAGDQLMLNYKSLQPLQEVGQTDWE